MRNTILLRCAKILAPLFAFVAFISIKATGQSVPNDFYKPKVDFTTGSAPASVALQDVDGDSKPDMVVANSGSNTISVFRNVSTSGSISASSFAAKVDFTTGTTPACVAIGDLDGDGKPDLVVTNRSANAISVLHNISISGSINASSFAAKIDFATGAEPISAAIGDVDGDGKPDIVVNNYGSNTISVFRNTSTSGSINASSFAAKEDFATSAAPSIVAIGDVDGDGKPDLAVSNFLSHTISVLRNTSTSGSINASSFAVKVDFATGDNPYFVVINDVDGDGKPELIICNVSSTSVSVLHNTSITGSINGSSFATKVDFVVGSHPVTVAIKDLDGDTKPDVIVSNQLSDNISVLRNTSTVGTINASTFAPKTDFATGNQPVSVSSSDLDGDGIPEIAATNYNSNTVSVFQKATSLSTSRSWQWANHPDGHLAPYTYPAISADGNGNTYVAGGFDGTLTFPTSPLPTVLTSAGESDVFIAKYDATGNVVWAKRAGGTHGESASAIKYDGFGNIYIVGNFSTSTDFDGTIFNNPVTTASNVFIAKYNATTGNLLWAKQGATTSCCVGQTAFAIAVDQSGNAYITGGFTNITFDPLPKMYAEGSSEYNGGWPDIFIVKYNSDGVPQWQTRAGANQPSHYYNFEQGNGIAVDLSGNLYVTGSFNGSSAYPTHFGGIDLISNGGGGFDEGNFFLAKYNQSTFLWEWAVQGGGTANDYGKNVSLDDQGNAYVSGYFEGTGAFGSTTLTATVSDYFIAKYNSAGNQVWVYPVEGVGTYAIGVSKADANGNLYFAGVFGGNVTIGDQTLSSNGYDNFYIGAWNSNGDFQWVKHVPGDYFSLISSLDAEDNGNIDITTVFAGSETFDCTVFGSGTYADLAVAKLGTTSSGPDVPTIAATRNTVCNGSSTTLSIASGNLNNATVWKWYSSSCGGTLIGTGNSIIVNPSVATTYYVRGEGGCSAPGACANITINIGSVNVAIPDAKALNYNSIANNTAYPAHTPASSITLTAQPSGTAPYNYSWSNGATTQSIIVNPTATTTYTVTVTDANGCTGTSSKQVTVKDVNCSNGKVYMCHITGNSGHVNTICIDNSAVAAHLAAGCSLGECIGSRTAGSTPQAEVVNFKIDILPNPSENYFSLIVNTGDNSTITVRVMDILGRVVEVRNNISANEKYKFGSNLKSGVYLAEITQGQNRKVIRLIKK